MELSNQILSDITVYMKYAKYLPDLNRRETWEELVTRNKNMHIKRYPDLKDEIEEKYKLVYEKKILPSMRSLQFGGKPIEISPNRVYNCAYLPIDHIESFNEIMFLWLFVFLKVAPVAFMGGLLPLLIFHRCKIGRAHV